MKNLREIIKAMPKTEIHLHLEGSIPFHTLWELIKKNGSKDDLLSIEELKKKFVFKDFSHFIEMWCWKNQFIKEYEDLELIASGVAEDLSSQNIKYAELFFTANSHMDNGLSLDGIVESILNGFSSQNNIQLKLIHDFGRNRGVEEAISSLRKIIKIKCDDIVGIGIGGPELGYPPGQFSDLYNMAREYGLKTNAHAGEADGASSIWGAIKELNVDRIGHCTRAYEDIELMDYLVESQIPLEMNPVSNIKTQVVESISQHPIKRYYDMGMNVTVNSDDPKMFGTSLENEYFQLVSELGFSLNDVSVLLKNGINALWCNREQKELLLSQVDDFFLTLDKG